MYEENVEVIKEVDFKEIKSKSPFYHRQKEQISYHKPDAPKEGKSSEKLQETVQKNNEYIQEELSRDTHESIKEVQERIEKIQNTAIYIKVVEDQGAMRAHIRHRITNQLLAVIPWCMRQDQAMGNSSYCQLQDYFGTFYANMSMGGYVDKQI